MTKIVFSEEENKEINDKISNFVKAMADKKQSANYYLKERRAVKPLDDIALGKKAEFFAAKLLGEGEVDLDVRVGRKKGWQPDLVIDGENYHVKSCNEKGFQFCGDYSWTFQREDPLLYSNSREWVVLVYLADAASSDGEIKLVALWEDVKGLLKNPLKKSLIGLKYCLYYRDLLNVKPKKTTCPTANC